QSFIKTAVQLAALPYLQDPATALPVGTLTAETPAAAFTKFGVPPGIQSGNIDEILETDITTFNLLDPASGAFHPDPSLASAEKLHVLISTPLLANVPTCVFSAQLHCAPMVIFRHGLTGGRIQMLLIAEAFAKAGMVTVAIDAAKHGDRSFCTSGTTGAESGCVGGAACTTPLPPGAQGDVNPPGTCGAAGFIKRGLNGVVVGSGVGAPTDGIPAATPLGPISGNYLITANFFRTRDTMRQDLIDQSQLIRALVVAPPAAPGATGNSVFDHMIGRGVIIDPVPGSIYYVGQSLGAIQGAMDVAANPRIAKAVLNVGGGTLVDVFTNSPAFATQVSALLASLGIDKAADPARYLQFLTVAKTVLDPADPVNYVGHLTSIKTTLPNLLPPLGGNPNGSVPQLPKKVLTQIANCDNVVPNPFGLVYSFNTGVGPLPPGAFAPGARGTFQLFAGTAFTPGDFTNPLQCTPTKVASHGLLLDFASPALTAAAQADAAAFLKSDTIPLSVRQ
ncbi:MAG TPA: hypothetical protein VK601_21840, partial [Kofleriaceae bacterium]|nr:hypothetical protein [Kofleriaceae bacterium]